MNFDTISINQQIDLLALLQTSTQVKWVASTAGGEFAGPCPFCSDHGRDRFRVQPNRQPFGLWMCRHCTSGRWQDAISLGQRLWPGIKFAEVCQRLVNGTLPTRTMTPISNGTPAYIPPGESFQVDGKMAIETFHRFLWESAGEEARDYLAQRGIREMTMKNFKLGFSPGAQIGELYIPRGVVIPCVVSGEVWYMKVALLPGQMVKCEGCSSKVPARESCPRCGKTNKYRGVRGNRPAAIFNANWLAGSDYALFVEGELDAMIAHQGLNDVLPCVTIGSAGNRLDLATWGRYLLPIKHMLVCYDNDSAGRTGAETFAQMTSRVHRMTLPEGFKDLNEWYLAGGDLWQWICPALNEVDPIQPHVRSTHEQ